jgi:hypothetical protein
LIIWSTAEGFGGPYQPGTTDIGTSIMYTFIFASLFLSAASRFYSVDRYLMTKRGLLRFLSSHRIRNEITTSKPEDEIEDRQKILHEI